MKPSIHCSCSEVWPLEKLVPNPRNPNKHTSGQIKLLAKILEHQGWRRPIVVSRSSGFIVSGHGRFEAAKKAGFAEVPVDLQDYKTEAEEWADLIADNRIAEFSNLDAELTADLVVELKNEDKEFDLDLTGFDHLAVMKLLDTAKGKGEAPEVEFSEVMTEANNYIVLTFRNEIDWLNAQTHFGLKSVANKRQNGQPWNKGIGRVIDGAAYLQGVTEDAND